MVQSIPLTRGFRALVDDEDLELIAAHRWHYHPGHVGYAATKINRRRVLMHRLLIEVPLGLFVDHRNGDGLDNRRFNLRLATTHQNNQHQRKRHTPTTSRFKGVHLRERTWIAKIMVNRKQITLGYFSFNDEEGAARAYDAAARETFGDFAVLNFPNDEAA